MIANKLLARLNDVQAELARHAMLSPRDNLFEHGKTVGLYQGLERAKQLLDDLLGEDEEKDRRL